MTEQERRSLIDWLIINCDSWKSSGDREILVRMTDGKLEDLREAAERNSHAIAIANKAVQGFSHKRDDKDGGMVFRYNTERDDWEYAVNEEEESPKKKKRKPSDYMEEEEEEEEEVTNRLLIEEVPVPRSHGDRPRTAEEWFRNAPAEVQNTFRFAREVEQREKDRIVNEILTNSNASEQERPIHRERLMRRSVEDLQNDLALLPKAPKQEDLHRAAGGQPANNGRARNGAPLGMDGNELGDEDMLITPTINWRSVDGKNGETEEPATVRRGVGGGSYVPTANSEEWLKEAPPEIRSVVRNAMVVEGREREKLIEELTANFQGSEDQERRLVARLKAKPLDELRDLATLAPRKETPKPNYFGSTAPLSNARPDDAQIDILPPPRMDYSSAN